MGSVAVFVLVLVLSVAGVGSYVFTTDELLALTEEKCVLVLASSYGNDTVALLQQLQRTFSVTDRVAVGTVSDTLVSEEASSITWLDDDARSDVAVLYPRNPRDRSCLLAPRKPESVAERYRGPPELAALVEFVNEKCGSFVNTAGQLAPAGILEELILQNLFEPIEEDGECERIKLPSQKEFFNNYLTKSKPVIITDAVSAWPALQKWTKEFFHKQFGGRVVHIKLTPDGQFEGVERASLWEGHDSFAIPEVVKRQLPYDDLVVVRPATQEINFSDFLSSLAATGSNYSSYLEYTSIPDYLPQLEHDMVELPVATGMLTRRHLNIWLGDGNTLGKLHFDPYDNFLCQIKGEKEVTLFDPHHNENLYEAHIQEAMLSFDPISKQFHRRSLLESTSMVMSPVDIRHFDRQRFPLFGRTKPYRCRIREGEGLYMPAFWWHEVQSQPHQSEKWNLAVNYWYEPFLTREFPCPDCRLTVNMFYKHLLEHPPT